MKVLSLFDGMSGGQIALKEIGIIPDVYYASEIDKHAIYQTQLNFPNTIQLGSVTNVDVSKLEPIDLLIGGSPCQSFSFAGKRKGMATKCEIEITKLEQYLELKEQGFEFEGQSYLFWEYMRILNDIRKYNQNIMFLLENVEMGNKWERVLSEAIGIYGVHINSALVSAQNRKRIYWTNIKTRTEGLFGDLYSDIPQPEDMGILLRDILEENVDQKYFLSEKVFNRLIDKGKKETDTTSKAKCITGAGGHGAGNNSDMNFVCVAMRGRDGVQQLESNKEGKTNCITSVQKDNLIFCCDYRSDEGIRVKEDGKSGTLCARARNDESCGQMVVVYHNMMPRSSKTGKGGTGNFTRDDGKTNCITSVQKDNLVMQYKLGKSKDFQRSHYEDKSYCLETSGCIGIEQNKLIRRLTPTECARLQTVPSWYIWECSETQQYKLLGNGWTIEVIKHIFKWML